MELQENLKRESFFRKSSILVLITAVAVQLAVGYVQHRLVSARLEIAVRTCATLLGFWGSPLLLFLGGRTWVRTTRKELSGWRNALGLSSMTLVSAVWMIRFGMHILDAIHKNAKLPELFFNLDWMAILLYSTMLATLLALALKGTARRAIFSAALLMWASLESSIYF
jgi:hypothetical protein